MNKPSSGSAVEATLDAILQKIRIPFIHRGSLEHDAAHESVFLLDLGLMGAFVERAEGLPVGSRVVLEIPAELGYGADGSPDSGIPKNATSTLHTTEEVFIARDLRFLRNPRG